jgi:uncharacterized membrane protein YagU involved in acid resistance
VAKFLDGATWVLEAPQNSASPRAAGGTRLAVLGGMNRLIRGALAGTGATVPMTAAMVAMHRRLPHHEQYPLPPREITEEVADDTGATIVLGDEEIGALALVNHFAFGAAMGGLYGPTVGRLPGPRVVKGCLFGLAVWASNYLVALPVAGLLAPATKHPPRRTALMIAAHLVYGAALGLLAEPRARRERGGVD